MSHARAGAITAMLEACVAGGFATADLVDSAIGGSLRRGRRTCPRLPREARATPTTSDQYDLFLHSTSYLGALAAYQHIYFAAYAEFRQVNARFDGKAAARKNAALVVNFEIIHVGTVAVDVGGNGMAGAVNKVLAVSGLGDGLTHRIIHLPPRDLPSGSNGILDKLDSSITRRPHHLEDFLDAIGHRVADETGPSDVVIHRVGHVLFAPDVEQNPIAFADRRRGGLFRPVMRVAAVRIHGNYRRIGSREILAPEGFYDPLLHVIS